MKGKRLENKQGQDKDSRQNKEEIMIQRLSAQVTGKAQKLSRIEPREFVLVEVADGRR